MGQYADPEQYEELMGAIQSFIAKVTETCEGMETAGTACADTMEGDPAAAKSNEKLHGCTQLIRESLESAQKIISDLQAELEEICSTVAYADEF